MAKLREMDELFNHKYYLSTDGYYFKYRLDKHNDKIIRATLYDFKDKQVDDVRKTEGYGQPEKSHHDVIDYFEARLLLTPPALTIK